MRHEQIRAAYAKILCKEHGIPYPLKSEAYTLNTGAKILKSKGRYYISGYAESGNDVAYYMGD